MSTIKLRKLKLEDLEKYKYWKQPSHAYQELNGPYYAKESIEAVNQLITKLQQKLNSNQEVFSNKKMITDEENNLIGEVSWYWKSKETNWMEIGIVIFDPAYWNKGVGKQALQLWINELFQEKKDIVRLGLSTWSGNIGMLKVAEKLGMKKEAEYRNARIVKGEYFDSISYGILKEEWEDKKSIQ